MSRFDLIKQQIKFVRQITFAFAVFSLWLVGISAAYNAPEADNFDGPYSTAMDNFHPTAPDAAIAGFIGPAGRGVCLPGPNDEQLSEGDPNNVVNPVFSQWAASVQDYSPSDIIGFYGCNGIGGLGDTLFYLPEQALGPVTGNNFDIVSLGDMDTSEINAGNPAGSLTIVFNEPISNGPGPDFAVFENAFISGSEAGVYGQIFAELAYVEVSSNGTDFVRFPCVSLTEPVNPIGQNDPNYGGTGPYGTIDPTMVCNLAGKHVNAYEQSWGTPFNLKDIADHSDVLSGLVDVNSISYIRIIDVPGNGFFQDTATDLIDPNTIDPNSGLGGTYYTQNHGIHDAWITWGSGGADIEAIGAIEQIYGDADSNGQVDLNDFYRLAVRWNRPGYWPQGDFSENGFVDIEDLLLLADRWLYRCPSRTNN